MDPAVNSFGPKPRGLWRSQRLVEEQRMVRTDVMAERQGFEPTAITLNLSIRYANVFQIR